MKLIADNMGLNLENVSFGCTFQNFSPSSFLPPIQVNRFKKKKNHFNSSIKRLKMCKKAFF